MRATGGAFLDLFEAERAGGRIHLRLGFAFLFLLEDAGASFLHLVSELFYCCINIIKRSGKLGLGTAYIAGFKWALEKGYDYMIEMDADFSHRPEDLIPLQRACAQEGADLSVGSRYITGVNVVNWPMGRVLMSYYASAYVRIVTGMNVRDTTAGFVCYKREVLETINLDAIEFKGYAFQIEMKFTAYQMGFRIKEVPIVFINRVLGTSKMSGGIFSEALFGVIKLRWDSIFNRQRFTRNR